MENLEENKVAEVAEVEPVVAAITPESPEDKKVKKLQKKAIVIVAIVIVLGVLAYLGRGLFIAATVNGNPISRLALVQRLEQEAGKDLLDALIVEKLIQNEAKSQNIMVSDADITDAIDKIEQQVTAQGGTFEEALAQQGLTMDILKKQILLQKQVEKLLADKVAVTDEEVAQYITDTKMTVPAGQEAMVNEQVRSDLTNQKLNTEAPGYISELKSQAKIKYFVNY